MMSSKDFAFFAGGVFTIVAVLHAFRILNGWEAVIGGFVIPMWISWAVVALTAYLAYQGIMLGKK